MHKCSCMDKQVKALISTTLTLFYLASHLG